MTRTSRLLISCCHQYRWFVLAAVTWSGMSGEEEDKVQEHQNENKKNKKNMYVSHSFSLSFGLFDCDNYPSINAPCVQMLDGLSLHGESDCVKTVLPPQPLVKCFVPQAGPRVSELRSRTITVKHPWTNGTFWHWWMTGSFIWEFRLNGAGADAVQITSLMTHSSLTNFWISARSVAVWHSTRFATIPHRLPNKEPSWPSDGWIISAPGWQLQQIHPQFLQIKILDKHSWACVNMTGESL